MNQQSKEIKEFCKSPELKEANRKTFLELIKLLIEEIEKNNKENKKKTK